MSYLTAVTGAARIFSRLCPLHQSNVPPLNYCVATKFLASTRMPTVNLPRLFPRRKTIKLPRWTHIRSASSTDPAQHRYLGQEDAVTIHYFRQDSSYSGWGLHLWGDVLSPTLWDQPLAPDGEDGFGVFWRIPFSKSSASFQFLIHKGEEKDCEGRISAPFSPAVWMVSDMATMFTEEPDPTSLPRGNIDQAKAFWVLRDTLAWNPDLPGSTFRLFYSRSAQMSLTGEGVVGWDGSVDLEVEGASVPEKVAHKFPHIAGYRSLKLGPTPLRASELLKCQLIISAYDEDGHSIDATGVQTAGVLDDLFSYSGPLGATLLDDAVELHLWAPTAQSVRVLIFEGPTGGEASESHEMVEQSGVWTVVGSNDWKGKYYLYEVIVFHPSTGRVETCLGVDPYSRGLSANGERTYLFDINDPSWKPENWEALHATKPQLEAFNDISILELHIRDFSISDQSVDPSLRGTYLAFTEAGSAGVEHLRALSNAGLTHLHLLPCFDFATVDEVKERWKTVDEPYLLTLEPESEEQQAAVVAIQDSDGFNWGYDPANWGVPEGSYATNPDGAARTLEFRRMVQGINRLGLRVVLDVVYNHTHGSGPHNRKSVLDKIVPGYYLRRGLSGEVESSTCMNNTASEHFMVDRLIVDDLLMWATQYKVDGFRFDLMGHLMKDTVTRALHALRGLTVERDGVDGSKIYLYGEGWDFGEVSRNQRGVNACQQNMANSGIGTFNDRLRDTALGGSPFGNPLQQGFLTGLALKPNDHYQGDKEAVLRSLSASTDWIRLGLAANLREYSFESFLGHIVKGEEILTHDGVPVGYAAHPEEVVNYVSAHDNETLFDVILLKTSSELSLKERCRINHMATSVVALQQGVAFFHAGDDMLRSKSLDRDSYNSGDWFNKLDFTYSSNNFGVGLPPFGKNGPKWDLMRGLLSNKSLKPDKSDILAAVWNMREMLAIRYSSPLFRLRKAEDIQGRLEFLNTGPSWTPGLIVMSIRDGDSVHFPRLDPLYSRLLVIFNAAPTVATVNLPFSGDGLLLHPIQAEGHDEEVKNSTINVAGITVPAFTTAVFVERHLSK